MISITLLKFYRSQFTRNLSSCSYLIKRPFFISSTCNTEHKILYEKKHSNSFSQRTHTCGELTARHIGQQVKLCGWLQYIRLDLFFIIRDSYGVTQILLPKGDKGELFAEVGGVPLESVVEVTGIVQHRPNGQENKTMSTGDIEVHATKIQVLNNAKAVLPFQLHGFHSTREAMRMQFRYIDLRSAMMQHNLRLRSQMIMKMREFLINENGFVDVETPCLTRETPGGAREFVVPTHQPNLYYTLPQSPQQFKQLLMVGGIDRYMQIAKCFRDESAKPDRQPEFTQLDIEMSFVNQEDIMSLIERLVVYSWPKGEGHVPEIPFPRMTYSDAMANYGVDKPDTRFDAKIVNVSAIMKHCTLQPIAEALVRHSTNSVHAFKFPQASAVLTKKKMADLQEAVKQGDNMLSQVWNIIVRIKEDGTWHGSLADKLGSDICVQLNQKMALQAGDVLVLAAGEQQKSCQLLGQMRLSLADLLEEAGHEVRKPDQYNFLWIYEFPLFSVKDDESGGFETVHHPFTAPYSDDVELVYKQPAKVRGQHYDLVLNGQEIGGGSIRIHDAKLQNYVLSDVLQLETSSLRHLLDALESGCPPHGGIALGLDRLFAILCKARSIRDVIAFPKSSDSRDLMIDAPGPVSEDQRQYYHLSQTKHS